MADGGRFKRGIFEAIADFAAIFRRDRGEGPSKGADPCSWSSGDPR
jgi:hypothetical protein